MLFLVFGSCRDQDLCDRSITSTFAPPPPAAAPECSVVLFHPSLLHNRSSSKSCLRNSNSSYNSKRSIHGRCCPDHDHACLASLTVPVQAFEEPFCKRSRVKFRSCTLSTLTPSGSEKPWSGRKTVKRRQVWDTQARSANEKFATCNRKKKAPGRIQTVGKTRD